MVHETAVVVVWRRPRSARVSFADRPPRLSSLANVASNHHLRCRSCPSSYPRFNSLSKESRSSSPSSVPDHTLVGVPLPSSPPALPPPLFSADRALPLSSPSRLLSHSPLLSSHCTMSDDQNERALSIARLKLSAGDAVAALRFVKKAGDSPEATKLQKEIEAVRGAFD